MGSLLLLTATIAAILACGELVVRIAGGPRVTQMSRVCELDPVLGWRPRRDLRLSARAHQQDGTEEEAIITTDARGFRAAPAALSGGTRVLITGDSMSFGDEIADDEIYAHRLAALTGSEVLLYAAPGYGTLQECMAVEQFAGEIQPDIVIVQLFMNDIINNSVALERRSAVHRVAVPKPFLQRDGSIAYVDTTEGPVLAAVRWTHSRFLKAVAWRLDDLLFAPRSFEQGSDGAILREGASYPGFQEAVETTERLLCRLKRACGATPVAAFCGCDVAPFTPALRQAAIDADLIFLDGVTVALRAAKERGAPIQHSDGWHWSPEGHRVVAEALAAELSSRGLLRAIR